MELGGGAADGVEERRAVGGGASEARPTGGEVGKVVSALGRGLTDGRDAGSTAVQHPLEELSAEEEWSDGRMDGRTDGCLIEERRRAADGL